MSENPSTKKIHPLRWTFWWALRGSNSRPSRCKRDALPAELSAHRVYIGFYTLAKINNQELFFHFFIFFCFYQQSPHYTTTKLFLTYTIYSLQFNYLHIDSFADRMITCLRCENLSLCVLCKDETVARFLV